MAGRRVLLPTQGSTKHTAMVENTEPRRETGGTQGLGKQATERGCAGRGGLEASLGPCAGAEGEKGLKASQGTTLTEVEGGGILGQYKTLRLTKWPNVDVAGKSANKRFQLCSKGSPLLQSKLQQKGRRGAEAE